MNDLFNQFFQNIKATTAVEWVAVCCGLLYDLLIIYKKIIGWFFAIISSFLYIYLCYISKLYLETGLQFFYLSMGFYGWYEWKRSLNESGSSKKHEETEIIIEQWPLKWHITVLLISTFLTLLAGYLFQQYTDQANPYTDAFTTIFSLSATYMMTKKVLENWIYWMVIDGVSIFLYEARGLHLTAVLFAFYTILVIFGYLKWHKKFKRVSV